MSPSLRRALPVLLLAAVGAAAIAAAILPANRIAPPPFANPSPLPFQAPAFDKIKDSDFAPALAEGMKRHQAEIAAIADNPAAPTFENTLVAMEKSGRMLSRAASVFYHLAQANTNETLQKVETDIAPKMAAHRDAIYLNPKLFARVRAVYAQRETLELDPESRQLLEVTHREFVHSGAQLSEADKTKLRTLNQRISTLETSFEHKLLAATKDAALVVDDKGQLAGLSDDAIASAAQAANERKLPGKYVITLQNTTQQPLLPQLTDRATRQRLFEAKWSSAERGDANDTRALISELAQLRAQKAALLGYPTWADYKLYDQMAKNPATVQAFLQQLGPVTAAAGRREGQVLQAEIAKSGGDFQLRPWDWDFYAERLRKAQYELDENQLKPYFELNRVLNDGVFYAANRLYGISFHKRIDFPTWHKEVQVYEVRDHDGSHLGLMYFDFFKRDNKSGGAWFSTLVDQSKLEGTRPVAFNVSNFAPPAPGQPALLTSDEVTTMFHEFGHALHGLFADQQYVSLSGTAVARDFVEFPSQFNEYWALYPEILKNYARHYQTGEPMPQALADRIKRAATFNQGYAFGELLAAAKLDMSWHDLKASDPRQNVDEFEARTLKEMGLATELVPPRYRTSYFRHIWGGGYSAAYYAYIWTQMLDNSARDWFEKNGGLTRANGDRFRDLILSRGNTMEYAPMYRAFYGRDPDTGPLLKKLGFDTPK
jgi:peptidyl-dipeptidase Dcp